MALQKSPHILVSPSKNLGSFEHTSQEIKTDFEFFCSLTRSISYIYTMGQKFSFYIRGCSTHIFCVYIYTRNPVKDKGKKWGGVVISFCEQIFATNPTMIRILMFVSNEALTCQLSYFWVEFSSQLKIYFENIYINKFFYRKISWN